MVVHNGVNDMQSCSPVQKLQVQVLMVQVQVREYYTLYTYVLMYGQEK